MDKDLLTLCRIVAGYRTKKELAKELGVHPSSVTRWEAGTVPINEKWRIKLIQALGKRGLNQEQIVILNGLKKQN